MKNKLTILALILIALLIFGCSENENIVGVNETDAFNNQVYYCISVKILNSQGIVINETDVWYDVENWNDYDFEINKKGKYSIVCNLEYNTDRVCSAFWSIAKASWFKEYYISKPNDTGKMDFKDKIYFEEGLYNIKLGILEI